MSRRSNYKRRVVDKGRAQARTAKANASPSSNKAANDQEPKPPAKSPSGKTGHRSKLIDRLGRKRSAVIIAIASLAIGVAGLAATFYFGFSPSSPEPVIGKPIPTAIGGRTRPLFRDRLCTSIQGTKIILYDFDNAVSCGEEVKSGLIFLTPFQDKSYCANSYVLQRPGVYRCVIQADGTNTIADPCFGLEKGSVEIGKSSVECEITASTFGTTG